MEDHGGAACLGHIVLGATARHQHVSSELLRTVAAGAERVLGLADDA